MPSLLGNGPGVHYESLKTVNQSLKHKVNWCVLSLRLNECKLSASRTAAGRLFHTLDRPQRRLYLQISFLSVEQCSRCLTPSGDKSVPDLLHACIESPR